MNNYDEISFQEWKTNCFLPIISFVDSKGLDDPHGFRDGGWDGFCMDAILVSKDIDGETATDSDCLDYITTICEYWNMARGEGYIS